MMGSATKAITRGAAAVFPTQFFSTLGAANILGIGQKQPSMPQASTPPAITPPPTPTDQNPVLTAQERAKKLAGLKYGISSTIKNNPLLAPAQTSTPALKSTLGA
jgi:hypothetical protein